MGSGKIRPPAPPAECIGLFSAAEGEGPELDLTPGALDKTNDPVRMYLREMGTVPLLTREGEVEIARRIERGKLSVIKSISRMPAITKAVIRMGDQLRAGERTIRELVIFNDEEITEDKIEERAQQFLKQVDAVRKARLKEIPQTGRGDTRLFALSLEAVKRGWRLQEIPTVETAPSARGLVASGMVTALPALGILLREWSSRRGSR